jgi:catechol 2,3-dioxygenase-like lactoylglutathione lyase family enzyme
MTTTYKPAFQDIAHLGHAEILTPRLEESAAFFKEILGLQESGRTDNSIYFRAWADYELQTLQLTGATTSGIGHVAFRARNETVFQSMVDHLQVNVIGGEWREPEFGHGRAFRFQSPDGHNVELYYDTERFQPKGDQIPSFKNLPQRFFPHGIAPKRLDHINLLAQDVKACREFFNEMLGLRITEQNRSSSTMGWRWVDGSLRPLNPTTLPSPRIAAAHAAAFTISLTRWTVAKKSYVQPAFSPKAASSSKLVHTNTPSGKPFSYISMNRAAIGSRLARAAISFSIPTGSL